MNDTAKTTSNVNDTSFELNGNTYFVTEGGIYKQETASSPLVKAGAPLAPTGNGKAVPNSSGFLLPGAQVAYRVVWGYLDANKNLILGAPSDRIVVENNRNTTADVSLTFPIPKNITPTWFYQVYRTHQARLIEPLYDELQLVHENNPTLSAVSAVTATITITDSTPEALRQAQLYTNLSVTTLGIQDSNDVPPIVKSACAYNNIAFYGNTYEHPNRLYFSKYKQPEAVPLHNFIDVGSYKHPIERMTVVAKGIEIHKADGLFMLTGTNDSNFTVQLIDKPPIKGYRNLSAQDIATINAIKEQGSKLGELIEQLRATDADQRWISIGVTQLQQGLMALTRSVAKPLSF